MEVSLGPLRLRNPVLTASGTYGLGYEFAGLADLALIGGVVGKTVTMQERIGNPPPRTFETAGGMLNSIGLMNPGWDGFVADVLPRVAALPCPFILNVAGETDEEFVEMTAMADGLEGVAALELNLSCPNVARGLDFSATPEAAAAIVSRCVAATSLPILAKLSPNVADIVPIAVACEEAGATALSLVNTYLGTAIDWRGRKTIFSRGIAGLSGPAIKPMALLAVLRTTERVGIPVVGIGGIRGAGDILEYLAAGATAVQVGTACFLDPRLPVKLAKEMETLLEREGVTSVADVIGSVRGGRDAAAEGGAA
jgi:dihydroorotate dehydrogenase (NAD+) catalytic subunit